MLLIVAGGAAASVLYVRVNKPYRGYATPISSSRFPQGAGSRTIGDRLVAAGVIRDSATYRVAL